MPIFNDLDVGLSHPYPAPQQGQVPGTVLIEGSRTIVWPRGGTVVRQDVTLWVTAWQAVGGSSALTFAAARFVVRQLEELADNPDQQPVFIQWTNSAAAGAFSRQDEHDGWYIIESVQPDYTRFIVSAIVRCRMTVTQVAPAMPASLAVGWSGAALSTTFSGAPVVLLPYPVGSTLQPATSFTRTGGEGAIPITILASGSTVNPAAFVRPGTIAGLFTGAVKVFDTINTGSNPVPAAGAGFVNANWARVYGIKHDWVGDLVVTNGLLLLLFQTGQMGTPRVYLWNTQGTAGWQQLFDVQYLDNALNSGTVRDINLDRVGLHEVRVRVVLSTSAGNYAILRWKLQAGQYGAMVEFVPTTQANTQNLALLLNMANPPVGKIMYDDAGPQDVLVTGYGPTVVSSAFGFGGVFGTAANGPIWGLLYQNPPSAGQPVANGSTGVNFGSGDTTGPAQNAFRRYGIFAIPFVTTPNLQAEAEGGALGTGWSSVADAAASAGNAAKAASGTASTNADLFGTSWVPAAGVYGLFFRVRVTSAAGSGAEMTLGLWDATSSAFVTSFTFAANAASTSYVWLTVSAAVTPTAGHNMQFRAVTAATLGTDWFIDEAVLLPLRASTLGNDSFPADIWAQVMFDKDIHWAMG